MNHWSSECCDEENTGYDIYSWHFLFFYTVLFILPSASFSLTQLKDESELAQAVSVDDRLVFYFNIIIIMSKE